MNDLALTYTRLEKHADAEKLQIKALGLRNKLLGDEHPDTIDTMKNLAITFYYLQKYTDAAMLAVKVVDVRKKIFGEEHSKTVEAVALLADITFQANSNTFSN